MDALSFTPPQVAHRYGVNADKVRGWIRAGEMRAINVAMNMAGRPRYVVTPEALAAFERYRSVTPAADTRARPARHRSTARIIAF